MRREHLTDIAAGAYATESSPHARGTPRGRREVENKIGIISACAGSTTTTSSRPRPRRDHPRMRGEHSGRLQELADDQGSSPHARGTLHVVGAVREAEGITPACAGNTIAHTLGVKVSEDHPRMRGEHRRPWARTRAASGSSPHTRGTLEFLYGTERRHGIIPAFAGSTRPPCHRRREPEDHPRIRGEHSSRP